MLITLQTRWMLRERGFFFGQKKLNNLGSFDPYRFLLTNEQSFNEERTSCCKNISVSPLLAERPCESQIHDFIDNTSKLCKSYLLLKNRWVTVVAKWFAHILATLRTRQTSHGKSCILQRIFSLSYVWP